MYKCQCTSDFTSHTHSRSKSGNGAKSSRDPVTSPRSMRVPRLMIPTMGRLVSEVSRKARAAAALSVPLCNTRSRRQEQSGAQRDEDFHEPHNPSAVLVLLDVLDVLDVLVVVVAAAIFEIFLCIPALATDRKVDSFVHCTCDRRSTVPPRLRPTAQTLRELKTARNSPWPGGWRPRETKNKNTRAKKIYNGQRHTTLFVCSLHTD